MLAAIGLLLVANALMHAEALDFGTVGASGWRLAVAVATSLIALIGGRIIPSFTRNWLAKRPGGEMPAPFARFDQLTLVATIAALVAWVVLPGASAPAVLLALAAALNLARLCRWQGHRTMSDPLVFILHVGYAWVPLGLGLLAVAQSPELLPESAAVHGLTAGAVGTMTLAVMTRATRGHTGRPLHADAGTVAVLCAGHDRGVRPDRRFDVAGALRSAALDGRSGVDRRVRGFRRSLRADAAYAAHRRQARLTRRAARTVFRTPAPRRLNLIRQ